MEESEAETSVSLHHETVSSTTGVRVILIFFFWQLEKINYHLYLFFAKHLTYNDHFAIDSLHYL